MLQFNFGQSASFNTSESSSEVTVVFKKIKNTRTFCVCNPRRELMGIILLKKNKNIGKLKIIF
jgi:hypothetical protein